MKTVVVYESMYGNTHAVAETIGSVLAASGPVDVVPVLLATPELVASADLLVVGGPTHAHSMSTRTSRTSSDKAVAEAIKRGNAPIVMDPHWQDPGLRDWFKTLSKVDGTFAAAFDTRFNARALLTGRASRSIAHKLTRHGYQLVTEPESFLVDKATRLLASEAERAAHWANGLSTVVLAEQDPPPWQE